MAWQEKGGLGSLLGAGWGDRWGNIRNFAYIKLTESTAVDITGAACYDKRGERQACIKTHRENDRHTKQHNKDV